MFSALTLVAALAGCSNNGSTNESQAKPISFMVFGDPAELAAYKELVAAFEKGRDQKVTLIHVPSLSDYRKRLGIDFAAGTPADVVLINYRRFAAFADKGVIEPLGPYLKQSKIIKEADFYPTAINAFKWKGELMAIPQNLSSLVVYYNKNHFDAAKLPYPKDDWTWGEFVRAAETLNKDFLNPTSLERYGLGTEVSLQRLAPFIWQNGGKLVDDDVNPTTFDLQTKEAMEAFQWFVDLRRLHKVVPTLVEEKSEDSESRFINGRISMFLQSRRGVPNYREIQSFDWDVAPLPRGQVPAGILHADAFFMPKSAKNKQAVWTFIEFANSVEGQTILAKSGRTVPSLKAVAESEAFLDPSQKPKNSRVFLDTLDELKMVPIHPAWNDLEVLATDELERAFYGTASVESVIEVLTERASEFIGPPKPKP